MERAQNPPQIGKLAHREAKGGRQGHFKPDKATIFSRTSKPYKKTEALSEGLKQAQIHKFNSDQRAERKRAKVSEVSTRNSKLGARINRLLGNGDGDGEGGKIRNSKTTIHREAKTMIDGVFSPDKPSERELADMVQIRVRGLKTAKNQSQKIGG